MRKVKGSLTVEASLIFPLILAVFVLAMSAGFQLYRECLETGKQISQEEFDTIKWFYRCKEMGELTEWK